MIVFNSVSKHYADFLALDSVSLTINRGEIFGILGSSGAGKSTLLKCINLLERPTQGHISINNNSTTSLSFDEERKLRQSIGFVFQDFSTLQHLNVKDNILLPLKIHDIKINKEYVEEIIDYVGLLDFSDKYPHQLSGGQLQRVAIARALISQPEILLCDEPTSALDPKSTQEILGLLKDINSKFATTIVIVTHDLSVAKTLCNRAAILQDGKLVNIVSIKNSSLNLDITYSDYVKEVLES